MKKIWKFIVVSLFSTFFLCTGRFMPVQAAPYQAVELTKNVRIGNLTFTYTNMSELGKEHSLYVKKNGKKILLARDKSLESKISTNGTYVYYSIGGDVYQVSINGKNRKKVLSSVWFFGGRYGRKLYYAKEMEPSEFYSYDLKTKKKKLIIRDSSAIPGEQYKHCFLLGHPEGDFGPDSILVYNAKKGKIKKFSDKMYPFMYAMRGNYIYYTEFVEFNYNTWYYDHTVAVKRWNINTFKTETLIKKIKVHTVNKFTKNSITYVDENGKTRTRKF